jgi:hypothetical protein
LKTGLFSVPPYAAETAGRPQLSTIICTKINH